MFHPHTNELEDMHSQTTTLVTKLTNFCDTNHLKLIWFAPNNDPGHVTVTSSLLDNDMEVITNVNGNEYLELLARARFIIGNTSSCIREASYLGTPAIIVGDRQQNRTHADNVLFSDFSKLELSLEVAYNSKPKPSNLFGDGYSSEKIVAKLKELLNVKEEK
jgi:UDP-N-acetylglucosamine 2-epimerase (hydrolysing)